MKKILKIIIIFLKKTIINYQLSINLKKSFTISLASQKNNSLFLMINTKHEILTKKLNLFFDLGYYKNEILINYSGNSSFFIFL